MVKVLCSAAIAAVALATAAVPAGASERELSRVVVRFADDATASERRRVRAEVDARLAFALGDRALQVLELEAGEDLEAAARRLGEQGAVEDAWPDERVRPWAAPDPRAEEQWWMKNTGQQVTSWAPVGVPGADVGATAAWRWTRGAGSPPLAIVDTGTDLTHEDLQGIAWTNPGEIAGNGVDDDANGHVDDVHGWNSHADSADITDGDGHGSGMAGLVAATPDNGVGMAGLAPEVDVMTIRSTDEDGYSAMSYVAEGIEYAAENGARVVNLSLGTTSVYGGEIISAAIAALPDVLFVAAAGNKSIDVDQTPVWPCVMPEPNVLCVAATTPRDELAGFSNFGSGAVDMAAPGSDMLLTVPGNLYGRTGGTSASAPLVSATAQLLLAVRPDLSVDELVDALTSTGKALPSLAATTRSGRRLDAAAALERVAGPPPPDPLAAPDPPAQAPPQVSAPVAAIPSPPSSPQPGVDGTREAPSSAMLAPAGAVAPAVPPGHRAPVAAQAAPKRAAKKRSCRKAGRGAKRCAKVREGRRAAKRRGG